MRAGGTAPEITAHREGWIPIVIRLHARMLAWPERVMATPTLHCNATAYLDSTPGGAIQRNA
jgi:hypothetical protein